MEILRAADALIKAGAIAPPPAPAGDGWFDAEYTQALWSGVDACIRLRHHDGER